eukprot:8012488-Pyramimonas_sp.AAC.1
MFRALPTQTKRRTLRRIRAGGSLRGYGCYLGCGGPCGAAPLGRFRFKGCEGPWGAAPLGSRWGAPCGTAAPRRAAPAAARPT